MSSDADHRIVELLDDPLVRLMMRADGVDRAGLKRELRRVAAELRDAEQGRDGRRSQDRQPSSCLASGMSSGISWRMPAHAAAHIKAGWLGGGACCR